MHLPGMTGLELQRTLTAAQRFLPIVFITGHGDVPTSVQAMKGGAVDFLPKPFLDADLLKAVSHALDRSAQQYAMRQKLASFVEIVRADPAVESVVAFTGGGQRNSGSMFVGLKPRAEREQTADQVIARLRGKLAHEPGANLFLVPVQDIRIGGRQANAQYQYTLQADDLTELRAWEPKIRAAMAELPELVDVNTDQQDKGQQTTLVIDPTPRAWA
jgi:multidrug efflux pump